jgi:hypothetical protein
MDTVGEDLSRNRLNLVAVAKGAAIFFGIASAVLLAQNGFGIKFNEDFLVFLKVVENTVGAIVFPFDLLVVGPVLHWLRDQGWTIQLYAHWHYAFVLIWLYFSSDTSVYAPPSLLSGNLGLGELVLSAIRWIWAAFTALVGAALAGTVPLDDPAVLWWPIAAYFVFNGGDTLIYALARNQFMATEGTARESYSEGFAELIFFVPATFFALGWATPPVLEGHPPVFLWAVAAYFGSMALRTLLAVVDGKTSIAWAALLLSVFLVLVALALGVLPTSSWFDFKDLLSPGLANLTAVVVCMAVWHVCLALLIPEVGDASYFERVVQDGNLSVAVNVLTVLGGAATISYLARIVS